MTLLRFDNSIREYFYDHSVMANWYVINFFRRPEESDLFGFIANF